MWTIETTTGRTVAYNAPQTGMPFDANEYDALDMLWQHVGTVLAMACTASDACPACEDRLFVGLMQERNSDSMIMDLQWDSIASVLLPALGMRVTLRGGHMDPEYTLL